jgi:ankyrin repeat protein
VRYLAIANPGACLSVVSDRNVENDGEILTTKWNPIDRAIALGHINCARVMLSAIPVSKGRDKALYFKLNWSIRKDYVMSIALCKDLQILSLHGKQDCKHIFLKLYFEHFNDLWISVMSYL